MACSGVIVALGSSRAMSHAALAALTGPSLSLGLCTSVASPGTEPTWPGRANMGSPRESTRVCMGVLESSPESSLKAAPARAAAPPASGGALLCSPSTLAGLPGSGGSLSLSTLAPSLNAVGCRSGLLRASHPVVRIRDCSSGSSSSSRGSASAHLVAPPADGDSARCAALMLPPRPAAPAATCKGGVPGGWLTGGVINCQIFFVKKTKNT